MHFQDKKSVVPTELVLWKFRQIIGLILIAGLVYYIGRSQGATGLKPILE